VAEKLGQEAPAMDQVSADEPDEPPLVKQFWEVYSELTAQGCKLNHHREPLLIGIHLKDFIKVANQNGYKFVEYDLKQQLSLSVFPCLTQKNLAYRSKHLQKTIKIWLFDNSKARLGV